VSEIKAQRKGEEKEKERRFLGMVNLCNRLQGQKAKGKRQQTQLDEGTREGSKGRKGGRKVVIRRRIKAKGPTQCTRPTVSL